MKLTLGRVTVRAVSAGEKTRIVEGELIVHLQELAELLARDGRLSQVRVELARPGESVRIIPVKDVIQPRLKVAGAGSAFPGAGNSEAECGDGYTKVMEGVCVTTTGRIVAFQEGLIDMSGPGAECCHFSQQNHVVLVCEPIAGLDPNDHEKAVRLAGLKAAAYLAESLWEVAADAEETYLWPAPAADQDLPRVVYLYQVLAQGLLHDNYLYGLNAKRMIPTLISPNELYDGALVSGNCVTACDKNTTYDHMNNPVVAELQNRHGKELIFAGVILHPVSPGLADKERNAAYSVRLAHYLQADGMVITEEGGGNPETDLMLLCRRAEQSGIRTVIFLHENAGEDGRSEAITYTTSEADAVISVGNTNEIIHLPAMERVIGHSAAADQLSGSYPGALRADGSLAVPYAVIIDAVSNLGMTRMAARDR
jgi:glycine reductase complex component B subunit alpha and beta